MNTEKMFIISLPRTGTTSACLFFLDLGLKVAHTAYSQQVFLQADVVADTPVFADYEKLDEAYPNSKFIYLSRPTDLWLASIRRLLKSMRKSMINNPSAFDKEIVRCFRLVFPGFEAYKHHSDDYLLGCLSQHRKAVETYFLAKPERLIVVDITDENIGQKLMVFCGKEDMNSNSVSFPRVNIGRRITYWDSVQHANKIES